MPADAEARIDDARTQVNCRIAIVPGIKVFSGLCTILH
jgi:hypothetical protein